MDQYERKLNGAKEFLDLMSGSSSDRPSFERNFGGFLNCSRSVVQYAVNESIQRKTKPQLLELLNKYPYIRQFKDIRDTDVHEEPVIPKAHHSTMIIDRVVAKDAVYEIDNSRWSEPDFSHWPPVEAIETMEWHRVEYSVAGLSNDFNLIGHCSGYLEVLEIMLLEARHLGLLASHK